MVKAVIATGGKQYLVTEGETLNVELVATEDKQVSFVPLMLITDDNISVGQPTVEDSKVVADIIELNKQADKVIAIRYKAKKRVHKVRGHRQHQTILKITKIS